MIFWSEREIKMPQYVVFRLKQEIKMHEIQKLSKKPRKTKLTRKFHSTKISCLKVGPVKVEI